MNFHQAIGGIAGDKDAENGEDAKQAGHKDRAGIHATFLECARAHDFAPLDWMVPHMEDGQDRNDQGNN